MPACTVQKIARCRPVWQVVASLPSAMAGQKLCKPLLPPTAALTPAKELTTMPKKNQPITFDFGFNVKPRKKTAPRTKRKRANPKRAWKGITFGS